MPNRARSAFHAFKARFRRAGRLERAGLVALLVPTIPVVLPAYAAIRWRKARRRRLRAEVRIPFAVPAAVPAPALDPAHEAAMAARPDTFALVRVIGNDLPPRHSIGQSRGNLRFILENEPDFPDCRKFWIVNRILDADEEARVLETLEAAGQDYRRIPFVLEDYARVPLDLSVFPPGLLHAPGFGEADPAAPQRAKVQAYRLRNNYVMHNNGARNAALEWGLGEGAKWVLPFDGNGFLTRADWDRLVADIRAQPGSRYFTVGMARLPSNEAAMDPMDPAVATEEPQVAFRSDAALRFDEAHPYGRRPKVELLARLNLPGPWQAWAMDPWDLPAGPVAPDSHLVGRAGMIRRLASGRNDLEAHGADAARERAVSRSEAIVGVLRGADLRVMRARGYAPDRPLLYRRDEAASPPVPLADAVRAAALAALERAVAGSGAVDPARARSMSDDAVAAALAFAGTGEERFRHHASALIERLLLGPAGGRPKGETAPGSIACLLDAARLLDDADLSERLRGGLAPLRDRLLSDPEGADARRAPDARGTSFDLRLAAVAAFLGDVDLLLDCYLDSLARLPAQIAADGAPVPVADRARSPHDAAPHLQSWLVLHRLYEGAGLPVEVQPEFDRLRAAVARLLSGRDGERDSGRSGSFDGERLAPIALMAAAQGLGPEPTAEDRRIARERPLFPPRDGIPPFWPLMAGGA